MSLEPRGLDFTLNGSGTGPPNFRIDVAVDGAPFETAYTNTLNVTTDMTFAIDALSLVVTESIRFRLIAWGATGGSGTLRLTDGASSEELNFLGRAVIIRGRPAQAELEAEKGVMVFSENDTDCGILAATPPTEPANPAAIPGACIQYTISVANTGPVAAQNVTLTDVLPDNLSFQAAGMDTNWGTLVTTGCPGAGCEVKVESGTIAAGATATLTIRATIN